jgi:hypothetical protein
MYKSQQVTATTAAAQISLANDNGHAEAPKVVSLYTTAADVYIGGVGVTAATGFLLPASIPFSLANVAGEDLYVIKGAGSGTVHVLENLA